MNPKELLRSLESDLQRQNAFQPEEIHMKISENEALVFIPVEGVIKLMRVKVEEFGTYTGLNEVPQLPVGREEHQLQSLK